jgi:hypothetical protein
MTAYINKNYKGENIPRLEGEHPDILPNSPLAVIGLFIFAVRSRFDPNFVKEEMPWIWVPNLNPEEDYEGPSRLYITSMYNVEDLVRNYYPAIYIGRAGGPVSPNKVTIANRAGVYLPTQLIAYHCMCQMPLVIECRAENMAESANLAEVVWCYLLSSVQILRKDFGLHDITVPFLGDPVEQTLDKKIWVTTVQTSVTFDMRWCTEPIAARLQEITLKITNKDTDIFTEIALM